jgi:hypothetical protein
MSASVSVGGTSESVPSVTPWMDVVGSGGQYGPIPEPQIGKPLSVHAEWEARRREYDFYELSFRGGPNYKYGRDAAGEPVLIRHQPIETDDAFERRVRLAIYRNHCKSVIRRFNSTVFRKAIQRDGSDPGFVEWSDNVDGQGTSLAAFIRRTVQKAQICGRYLIGVETNRPQGTDGMTQAQAEAAGLDVFLVRIDPRRMIDWRRESDVLTEALIIYGAGDRATLYRWDTITKIRLDDKGLVSHAETFPNGWGSDDRKRIPILEVAPFEDGLSQLADVAELNRHAFNLETLLGEEIYGTTFTQYWVIGMPADAIQTRAEGGASRILCLPNPEAKIQTTGGDPAQAESLRTSVRDTKEDLYLMAGLKAPDPLQVSPAKSGVALKVEFDDVDTIMSAIASEAQRIESQLVMFYNQAKNAKVDAPRYPETFGTPDSQVELQRWQGVSEDHYLPPTLKLLEGRRIVRVLQPTADTDSRRLMEEQLLERFGPDADPERPGTEEDVDPMEAFLRSGDAEE